MVIDNNEPALRDQNTGETIMTITESISPAVDNSVDLEALLGASEALTAAPPVARFTFGIDPDFRNWYSGIAVR